MKTTKRIQQEASSDTPGGHWGGLIRVKALTDKDFRSISQTCLWVAGYEFFETAVERVLPNFQCNFQNVHSFVFLLFLKVIWTRITSFLSI